MPSPVLSVGQMREWEQASWNAGPSQSAVIAEVGKKLALRALALTKPNSAILLLAGRGHNGDDARAAVPHLERRQVQLLTVTEPAEQMADLHRELALRPALVIDALFGIGLNRPLRADWVEFVNALNASNLPILSVDLPSGLDANSGEPLGAAVKAALTLTVGAVKKGLLDPKAYSFTGKVELAPNIGLIPLQTETELQWACASDFENFPPRREISGHKGTYGHLAIISGSKGYHGAAILAARGAARAMPGLISVFCDEQVYLPVASQLQVQMVHPFSPGKPLPENASCIVIGPGLASDSLGPLWKEFLNQQWRSFPHPMIVDASALSWLQAGSLSTEATRLITPHPGEAGRMLARSTSAIQENRLAAVRELSTRFGNCWVLLKGHQTLIGRHIGPVSVNSSGNPFMAQGGAGDLLSGYLGGLLAQSKLQEDPLKTIQYAAWQHGAAADELSAEKQSWGIEDLAQTLGNCPPNLD